MRAETCPIPALFVSQAMTNSDPHARGRLTTAACARSCRPATRHVQTATHPAHSFPPAPPVLLRRALCAPQVGLRLLVCRRRSFPSRRFRHAPPFAVFLVAACSPSWWSWMDISSIVSKAPNNNGNASATYHNRRSIAAIRWVSFALQIRSAGAGATAGHSRQVRAARNGTRGLRPLSTRFDSRCPAWLLCQLLAFASPGRLLKCPVCGTRFVRVGRGEFWRVARARTRLVGRRFGRKRKERYRTRQYDKMGWTRGARLQGIATGSSRGVPPRPHQQATGTKKPAKSPSRTGGHT